MEAVKRQRKAQRAAFSKAHTAFLAMMTDASTREEKAIAFQLLENKMAELDEAHAAYMHELFQSSLEDEAIDKELETDDTYKTCFFRARLRMTNLMGTPEHAPGISLGNERKQLKLPKIELPKFNGNIKEWLPFWSQFKKIHEDQAISKEDKFQYLLQATVSGSRASELVASFSPTGENYDKAVTSLKTRFGRDDIVVEFYVRELLGLVLQNAVKGNKRSSLTSLYDKVESYIRAFETLGVTTDKCAAMLYPLVESSLPEEVLRAWQRSGQQGAADANGQEETKDRLARLLRFLQLEVENEQSIDMALTVFGLSPEPEGARKQKSKPEVTKNAASASVLLVSKDEKVSECLFCKSNHESNCCDTARKMKLDERRDIVKRENGCISCLKRGHTSKKCRVKVKCDWCTKHHVLLMCPGLGCNGGEDRREREKKPTVAASVANAGAVNENNLAAFSGLPTVCLQTLRVKLYSPKREKENGLTAFETHLGWTIMGKLPGSETELGTAAMITAMFVREANPSDLWRLDAIGITDPIEKSQKSEKDERTLNFLLETARFTEASRYEVRLPWVEDHAPISTNYEVARSRLLKGIEKLKKQNLYESYDRIFREWLSMGIIERDSNTGGNDLGHYLPHRPVIKMHSTTKIRPVFDASACVEGHPSLNQCLEKGPNLIELIPSSLSKFREGEIGVVSDITKAFLQISVNRIDRDYLRFLWVEDGRIIVLRHCRVVFGLACSPFLLADIITLHLSTALKSPERKGDTGWTEWTVNKLKGSFYVDNCVMSVNTVDELERFVNESTALMASGGFELRGWESSGDRGDNETTLVLGLLWNKRTDTITVNPTVLDVNAPEIVTKRVILSATHRVSDPIGFACPVSLHPKLLLQALWEEKISWDTENRDKRREEFLRWVKDLPNIKQIEIPRRLGKGNLTLHAFGDASGSAYAAVVFARIEGEDGVTVRLMSAKSRVAPKRATIPRLELMAAGIAVRLASAVAQSLTRKVLRVTYW